MGAHNIWLCELKCFYVFSCFAYNKFCNLAFNYLLCSYYHYSVNLVEKSSRIQKLQTNFIKIILLVGVFLELCVICYSCSFKSDIFKSMEGISTEA